MVETSPGNTGFLPEKTVTAQHFSLLHWIVGLLIKMIFLNFLTKTYVVVTQKNHLNETVL